MSTARISEDWLQRAAFDQWRARPEPGSIFAAIPNGGARDRVTGAKLKASGVLKGMLDTFGLGDVPFLLELKSPSIKNPEARLSPEQRDIIDRLRAKGVPAYVSGDLDEVIEILERHQVLKVAR